MSAGLGWFPHVVSGAPRQRGVAANVTASRLGLIEYASIPSTGHVSPVDSTDGDAGGSLLCLVRAAPRLPQRARSGSRAGMASVIFHIAVISIVISVAAWSRSTARAPDTAAASMQQLQLPRLVFLVRPEPGG